MKMNKIKIFQVNGRDHFSGRWIDFMPKAALAQITGGLVDDAPSDEPEILRISHQQGAIAYCVYFTWVSG